MSTPRRNFRTEVVAAYRRLRGGRLSPTRLARSVALGLFVGCLPLYGTHFFLCAGLGMALGADALVAYAAAHISIPPLTPLVLYGSAELGSLVLEGRWLGVDLNQLTLERAPELGLALLVGSVLLGLLLALVGGVLTYVLARGVLFVRGARAEDGALRAARARVVERYSGAPTAQRSYVRGKLAFDPLTAQLAELARARPTLGDVTDAGAGRGQFALLLLELGALRSLYGFDHDAAKVELARRAAAGASNVRFEVGTLEHAPLPPTDTLLLLDVLHYLPAASQRAVLERCAGALRPGGLLVLRETGAGLGARASALFERIGRALGINRGETLDFTPSERLVELAAGFGLSPLKSEARGPLDNVLCVFERAPAPSTPGVSGPEPDGLLRTPPRAGDGILSP